MELPISEIRIGKRHRKDLGDIDALAASIETVGLLHPVVVQADNTLVVGARRIAAFKKLGRDKIPASVAKNISDLALLLRAETDENTCRKAFDLLEAVSLGTAIEKSYKPIAEAAKAAGQKSGGGDKRSEKAEQERSRITCPKAKQDESARTSSVAAAAVGMSRANYEKAKAVVASGNASAIDNMQKRELHP